ncbi:ketoacyl-synt-domain-containing protein [Plenodomus tracheiphilus IPT5]|uniref:Ketoacyl-synt-domain-containing protein n=1 Tax=Plenodomus tracheiphilus IPT5 TaxID=1408161 RepID=A0A6A7AMH9_9PLEO|nr:ketoacyl-synt-domain-containing protein [Plenodomus tracheiphilus IPT5]
MSPEDSAITSICSSEDGHDAATPTAPEQRFQTPVAVVGMGCRLPGHSKSPTALWDLLQRGGTAENTPPESRFNLAGHYDGTRRSRTMKSPGGMFMEYVNPAVFDGQFFSISRADCVAMDPQQRQLLEVAYEALENGGIPLEKISGTRTGVIVGNSFSDYTAIQNRDPEDRADSITIGLSPSILSNRLSHFFNINGPSISIDTACCGSLVSLDVACRFLDSHQADGMIVGGINLWLAPEHNEEVGTMNKTQSASGQCRSFDASADGYVKAEAANIVYLKRLDDAIRDNDPIRAIIRGTASNASGRTAGIANPSSEAQAAVARMAYKNAGITDFRATQYVECHGTGTLTGDPIEARGVALVFAPGRQAGQELIIGSIKSNVGHSEAAAGISGLIKTIMAIEHGQIPGNPTFIKPNPRIDWKGLKLRASRTMVQWPKGWMIRRASVNSFGFGGANAHAVLENATSSPHEDEDEEADMTAPKLLVFSANEPSSLMSYAKTLSNHLLNPTVSIDMDHLAYTLSDRRSMLYYRAFTITQLKKPSLTADDLVTGKQAPSPPRIGFVFTGQGAQWSQMGAELVSNFAIARRTIGELDEALKSLPEPPAWTLLEELTSARSGEALRQPEFSQPLVTALQLALLKVLLDWGIRADAVVGHSSGEIAAAAAAGLLTYADAIKTAFYRGQAAKKVGAPLEPVGMLAVGIGAGKVEQYLQPEEGKVQIACYNSPDSLTMSGTRSALEKLRDRLQADGHFARLLLVDLAYHSDYMARIGEVYEEMLLKDELFQQQSERTSSRVRMFSSVTGKLLEENEKLDAAYWKSNMVSPVRFADAASELIRDGEFGANFLIELGPANALSGPIAQIKKSLASKIGDVPYTSCLTRGQGSTLALYKSAGHLFLAGGSVSLSRVNRIEKHNAKVVVDLPNYSWNHTNRYWHETRASKEWRFKKFVNHDLLGSKIPATAWAAPTFKKVLKLSDVPFLKDHLLGSEIVFPGAAYIAMAVEAVYQTTMSIDGHHV